MFNLSVFDFERHDVAGEAYSDGNKISVDDFVDGYWDILTLNTSQWSRGYMGTIMVAGCGRDLVGDKMWNSLKGVEMEQIVNLTESWDSSTGTLMRLDVIIGIVALFCVWMRILAGMVRKRFSELLLRTNRSGNLSKSTVYELNSGNRKTNTIFQGNMG